MAKYTGLTDAEVEERIKQGLVNVEPPEKQRTTRTIILSHTLTYFNFINIFLGILVLATGQWKNALFLGVIVCNSLIGIVQELSVKKQIDKLSVLTVSHCYVVRNGKKTQIPVNELVMDDLVLLYPGDQLVTDGSVVEASGLEMNESMLTGESVPIRKKAGDQLLSGSFVSAGTGMQKVEKVGADCYANTIVKKARHKKRASSEMQLIIGRIIKVISVAIIPIGILLYFSQLNVDPGNTQNAILRTVSGVMSMIPEGLVLLTSVSFIIGVGRLAVKRALVQEMEAIEALARVTVLCTDKTGTITSGRLRVEKLIPFEKTDTDTINRLMKEINAAFSDTNATQDALLRHFGQTTSLTVKGRIPFSSARKFRAVEFKEEGCLVLGAPEFLLPEGNAFLESISHFSDDGFRVLLLGRTSSISEEDGRIGTVSPLSAIVLSDEVKKDAPKAFQYFADNKVAIKVISGDNPRTVSAVALKAGVQNADKWVDATTLPSDLNQLKKVISDYTVFGRVRPEQKQLFVKAWQANGENVAMVGDGVNDVLAIKDADCGIAMANGAEAAKQAAHIVLLDSDFTAMPEIVEEGRTIIANIERVSSLYLTKTIYSVVLCLLMIFLRNNYPFTTLQIGLINITCIGMPSFLLTLEHQRQSVSRGFLIHVLKYAVPGAMTMVASILLIQLMNLIFGWSTSIYSTFTLITGGIVGLLVVIRVLYPFNRWHKTVLGLCITVFVLAIAFLPDFYDIHSILMWWSLLLIPLAVVAVWLISICSRLMDFLIKWVPKKTARLKKRFGRI